MIETILIAGILGLMGHLAVNDKKSKMDKVKVPVKKD